MEAVTGVKKTLRIQRLGACDRCSGSGSEDGSKRVGCTPCGGTGQVTRVAQSFFGAIQQRVVCETCRGSGTVPEKPCRSCEGTGRKAVREDITVEIPAGISEGQTLRVRGSGDKGMPGQSDGDLFVVVQVREDARFRREGDDIHTTLGVHPTDVLLGATLSVETVHGPVDIEVPAGTQPGQILRIRAKGMPALGTSRHGDHYVQIDVLIPKKLSREERRLVEEWRQAKS
jgi:molecular chaperone DnaJ